MNLVDAVKSGKRFRKSNGTWIERVPAVAGQVTSLRAKLQGEWVKCYFFVEDFENEEWETEPEPKSARAEFMARVDSCFNMLRDLILEEVTDREGKAS